MKNLLDLKQNQQATIIAIHSPHVDRLMSMGLVPGEKIIFLRSAPLGDPLEFSIKNYSLSLRKDICKLVEVAINE
jgi:Fe2+ transport system protein FeoA